MSCSTRITEAPRAVIVGERRVDVADHHRREAEADLVAEQQRGLDISARPIATICCWPPDSAVPGLVRRSARIGNSP